MGNVDLDTHLARKVTFEIRKAKLDYTKSKAHLFHMSNPREWYNHINKIIGNKKPKLNFTNIPELAYKAIGEQVEIINMHFSNICNKYPPLNNYKIKLVDTRNDKNLDPV